MARPTNREQRRRQIAEAFERVLARHGLGGATINLVADEAEVAPGLIHHHFESRSDLVVELVASLIGRFRAQLPKDEKGMAFIDAYVEAALALQHGSGRSAAKAWVGLFGEAIRDDRVAEIVRKTIRAELRALSKRFVESGRSELEAERMAAGMLAFIFGALVFGALMPGNAVGFAAPFLKKLLRDLR